MEGDPQVWHPTARKADHDATSRPTLDAQKLRRGARGGDVGGDCLLLVDSRSDLIVVIGGGIVDGNIRRGVLGCLVIGCVIDGGVIDGGVQRGDRQCCTGER